MNDDDDDGKVGGSNARIAFYLTFSVGSFGAVSPRKSEMENLNKYVIKQKRL